MMNKIEELLDNVEDEKSFLLFVESLIADRETCEKKLVNEFGFNGDWANNTIGSFLKAAVAWANDSDFGVRQETELAANKWKQFAIFLYCGKIYE